MKNEQPIGCRWICWLAKMASRGLCVCPASEARSGHDIRKEQERRGDKIMNHAIWTHEIRAARKCGKESHRDYYRRSGGRSALHARPRKEDGAQNGFPAAWRAFWGQDSEI